jgi:diguanylate cyclase (GGDEF)-like protein
MPRVEGDTVTAVVVGAIDVDWFSRIALATERPSPGVEAMVLDATATVIGGSPNLGERLRGQSFLPSAIWPAPGDRGVVDRFEFEGGTYVAAYVALPATGGTLVIMKDRDSVLTIVNQQAVRAISLLSLVSVFVFALVWLGGEVLVLKPIKALTNTADALGSGDLSARATLAGFAPEFRRLGQAFNTMGKELQVRNDDLRSANLRLDKLARSDALTGLRNRRAFDEQLELEVARSMRDHRPLCLLIMDIDHFKRFNDHYGHAAGDDAIARVAAVIDANARRPGDVAARIGGEEFALVLGDCTLTAGQAIADDIVRSVAALQLEHTGSGHGVVTVSVGVAELELDARTSIRSLVERADKALYRAKMLGRNRSETSGESSFAARV